MLFEKLVKIAQDRPDKKPQDDKPGPPETKFEGKTKNYVVSEKNKPIAPEKGVWRRKVVYDKHGYKHVVTLNCYKGKCTVTSIWHEKQEPHAKKKYKHLKWLK